MKSTHISDSLTQISLTEITNFHGRPCLSLYQPTHRSHPENQQDSIRFRHLVKELEVSLQQQYTSDIVQTMLKPFEAIAQDHEFWNHNLDGLAVLGASGIFRVFKLQKTMAELAVVADSFHTKPLRQRLQSDGRYQVLALSLNKVQLFEGNRDKLDAVALVPSVPLAINATQGNERIEQHSTVSSYGGIGGGHMDMHHGQGSKKDVIDDNAERFFRAVDKAVLEYHSNLSDLPLMLAALPEHHHLFREISHNPYLMASGVMIDPQSLTHNELQQRTWNVISPQIEAQQTKWSDAYSAAAAKGLGSENLSDVTHAAVSGRVATLLIESERQVGGRIDVSTGRIDHSELDNPRVDDVLDDLGALVEKMGGQVHVLPADRMPCRTGVAASFRH
jgi:hypothetical protein